MAALAGKRFDQPDEVREFEGGSGRVELVDLNGHAVGRGTFEPGWRWSEHVKPIAGTEKCEATHLLYCMTGRMKIAHDDGTEAEIGPGDVATIEPGHDAWIVGDETFTSVDFGGYAQYGAPKS